MYHPFFFFSSALLTCSWWIFREACAVPFRDALADPLPLSCSLFTRTAFSGPANVQLLFSLLVRALLRGLLLPFLPGTTCFILIPFCYRPADFFPLEFFFPRDGPPAPMSSLAPLRSLCYFVSRPYTKDSFLFAGSAHGFQASHFPGEWRGDFSPQGFYSFPLFP